MSKVFCGLYGLSTNKSVITKVKDNFMSNLIIMCSVEMDKDKWLQMVCCNGLLKLPQAISGHFLHWNLYIFDR